MQNLELFALCINIQDVLLSSILCVFESLNICQVIKMRGEATDKAVLILMPS